MSDEAEIPEEVPEFDRLAALEPITNAIYQMTRQAEKTFVPEGQEP